MEADSPLIYHGTNDSGLPPASNPSISHGQLTPEEFRLLRDCNRESFYYRCLPLSLAGMSATYLAVQRGILRGHPKWGPAIKMTGAAFLGWILGKISYRSKCEEKFLRLENSVIGNALRKKKGYAVNTFNNEADQFSNEDSTLKDSGYTTYSSGDFHSSSGSLNFDRNAPSTELDDRDRPTLDSNTDNLEQAQPTRPSTTYDELRRKNREDYEKQQYRPIEVPKSDTYRRPWAQPGDESFRRSNANFQGDSPKNAYGDSWENPKFT